MNVTLSSGTLVLSFCALASLPERPPVSMDPVEVPKNALRFDDGDTVDIHWSENEIEIVRILGIDTPEVLHLEHDLPYPQPFGYEAAGFLRGCIAVADRVELLRSGQKDPYGRTLGYLILDGKNYSVLVIEARLAVESVSRYGDNGLPDQAADCLDAARRAGPVPFEDPHLYRKRMRAVSQDLKARGAYPAQGH
ncbi:MAG: thermonuclease family protein [Planctomycetes bacterium]|nr:thermonuclease family protein [Planctomycetota bacterium]